MKFKLFTREFKNNFFIYLAVLPIFASLESSGLPVFDRQPFGYESRTFLVTFWIGIFSFSYFCILSLFSKKSSILLIVLTSLVVGCTSFLLTKRIQPLFSLQFWILLIAFKDVFAVRSYKYLKKLSLTVSTIIFIIQVLILYNSFTYLKLGSVFEIVYIYNYEQYFAFAVIVGLILVSTFCKNKLILLLYFLVAVLSAIDSVNYSAQIFLIIFPFAWMLTMLLRRSKVSKSFKLVCSSFPFMATICVPIYFELLSIFNINIEKEVLGGRGFTFTRHLQNFDIVDFFVPKVFYTYNIPDPHNTFFTLGIAFGYIFGLILLGSISLYIYKLNFQHILMVSPLFSIAFSINEPLQHSYTAGLFALLLSILIRDSEIMQSQSLIELSIKN